MFKIIRITILCCLLTGVIFFGAKIYNKSSDIDLKPAEKSVVQVGEKIAEHIKGVVEKKLPKETSGSINKGLIDQDISRSKGNNGEAGALSPGTTKVPESTGLNPLDDEDRALTAEVLGEFQADEGPLKEAPEIFKESPNDVAKEKSDEPLDMGRLIEIRELYSRAIEALDWK